MPNAEFYICEAGHDGQAPQRKVPALCPLAWCCLPTHLTTINGNRKADTKEAKPEEDVG